MNMTIKDITNPFFSEIVKYIHKAANHSGYQIELCISNDDVNEEKATSTNDRQAGFEETIKENVPDMEIVTSLTAN